MRRARSPRRRLTPDGDRRAKTPPDFAAPADDSSGLAGWLLVLGVGVAGIVVGLLAAAVLSRRAADMRVAAADAGAWRSRSLFRRSRRTTTATPVVGGGSFNVAPILEPGPYRDTILPEEYLYYGFRLAAGQRLRVTLPPEIDNAADQAHGR